MPKVVVNLININQDISFLKYMLNSNKDAMTEAGFQLSTHSIENEIKYLEDFKNTFDLAIAQKQAELVQERIDGNEEACAQVEEAGGKIFATDQFGNIFYPPPAYQYSYVELSYGNYKKFKKVRFLGELLVVFTSRFQMENVKHNISPTTLKLLESIHKIRDEYQKKGLLEEILEYINKIDEACERAKSGKAPPVLDWKYFFKNYFSPSAQWKPLGQQIPKFDYEAKFDKDKLEQYLEEIRSKKEVILKALEQKKLESAANAKKENPSEGSKQDTDIQKPEVAECPNERENILQGLDDLLNDLNKNLEKQIEDYQRRFDLNCLAKELKDCLLPPDLDFCDFLFRDISVPKFYQKLSLLKAAGLGDLYNSLVGKMEDSFGVTELKQYEKEIKSLERLLREEDELRDRLNSSLEQYEEQMTSLLEDLLPLKEKMEILETNLDVERQLGRQTRINSLEKRREILLSKMRKIQNRVELLRMQNEAIPKNLETLNTNYDEHLLRKGTLERDFAKKIAENKFNERQAQLIREGKNLEAVFLIPNEDEKYSSEAVATTIINAVDAIMPLENLCKLLFTLPFNRNFNSSFKLPEDFWTSLMTKFKDPYLNLSADLGKLVWQLLIVLVFNILDSFLKALCDAIGNAVANTEEGQDIFETMGNTVANVGNATLNTATNAFASQTNQALGGNIFNGDKLLSTEAINLEGIDSSVGNAASVVADALGKQDMIGWFVENGQSSAFSEWELSLDGKSFVIRNPPLFDFTQVGDFINSRVTDYIKDQNYSTQALMDMFSKEEGSVVLEEEPPLQQQSLTAEEAANEMRCLLSKSMSLLTPTETINLLTKKPDQNTKNIVKKLADVCAPKMSENYPGDSLIELVGEIGILSGVLEVEQQIQGIQALNDSLPITERVICERFDNTRSFRASLMSQTMSPELAMEILNEVEKKQQEELGFVIDSITQLADAKIMAKPQTAKQFYLSAISQIVDMQEEGKEPQSIEDLGLPEQESADIDVKNIIKQQIEENAKNNPTLNSMFELTTESLVRPIRDRFKRDSENYLNAISKNVPFEKPLVKTQRIQTPQGEKEVPTMEFINLVNMSYVPALKCIAQNSSDSITISSTESQQKIIKEISSYRTQIEEAEQEIQEILENFSYAIPPTGGQIYRSDSVFFKEQELYYLLRTDIGNGLTEEQISAGNWWKIALDRILVLYGQQKQEWRGEYKQYSRLNSLDRKTESPFAEYVAIYINGWLYENSQEYLNEKIPTKYPYEPHQEGLRYDRDEYKDKPNEPQFLEVVKQKIQEIRDQIETEKQSRIHQLRSFQSTSEAQIRSREAKRKTFIPSGQWSFEEILVPSYVLPFSKKVDNSTILMSKIPEFETVSSIDDNSDTPESLTIKAKNIIFGTSEKEFYISNGFMEQNYGEPFVKQEEMEKVATTTETKKDIGEKYKKSIETLKDNMEPILEDNQFGFSVSSKHKSGIVDPSIAGALSLFGMSEQNIDYDSISSNKISIDSATCIQELTKISKEGISQTSSEVLNNLTNRLISNNQESSALGQKIKEAIPVWKISFLENGEEQARFSLNTSGKIFSPTGLYADFYHDTQLSGETIMPPDLMSVLVEKSGKVENRRKVFDDYTTNRFKQLKIPVSKEFLYETSLENMKNAFISSISYPRLLDESENPSQKMIEFFDLTREQTEYEKDNSLDPNVMDFVEIKEDFKQFYDLEQDEEMTDEQLMGQKGAESKFTKAAKNSLVKTFIRVCVNEYILKNIFIFDSLDFDKKLDQYKFVINDMANFVSQEAKRVKIGKEINRQSVHYYDLMVSGGKIDRNEDIEEQMQKWRKTNSFSSVNANPKMIEIVKQEYATSLEKFRKLLKCEEQTEDYDAVVNKYLSKLEETSCPSLEIDISGKKYVSKPNLRSVLKKGDMYIEKYANFPAMTEYAKKSLYESEKELISRYENSIITIQELSTILGNLERLPKQKMYECDSDTSYFTSPITFGVRAITVVDKNTEEVVTSDMMIKNRTYILKENNTHIYYVSPIAAEERPIRPSMLSGDFQALNEEYNKIYENFLLQSLSRNEDLQIYLKYCLGLNEITQIAICNSFMFHNDQDGRFLFEGTKMMISRMYQANTNIGNANNTIDQLNAMLQEQKRNEDNTGNPLGPALEAMKFFYRTPIQILKGAATIVDPNIALADLIVKGAAMAGNLVGQKVDIPYSLASLALLPFPIFNGVAPPIPPLSSYNVAMPVGPIFLALEPLLKDLPYYQNSDKGKLGTGDEKQNPEQNPLFCELSEEENE